MGWYQCLVGLAGCIIMSSVFVMNLSVIYLLEVINVNDDEYDFQYETCHNTLFAGCLYFHGRHFVMVTSMLLAVVQLFASASVIINIYKCWKTWLVTHIFAVFILSLLIYLIYLCHEKDTDLCLKRLDLVNGTLSNPTISNNLNVGLVAPNVTLSVDRIPGGCPEEKAGKIEAIYQLYMSSLGVDLGFSLLGVIFYSWANCCMYCG